MAEENKQKETKSTEKKEQQKPQEADKSTEEKAQLLNEPIKVRDYVYFTILSLEGKAWAFMDFIVHPETQKHEKDLTQAKLAIDAMDALFKLAENELTSEQKKDVQNRMTNLRLNFAKG
ncbi:hypothetical protein AMJ87_06285 [candidate division WOR_3 bacterium SM23_60]|uniref:DUF1844 domain-containing protein n=1 Tax=candidate division WOR_3 bacterium SM23_60 TaxID=1703780 RepID=A0A0S8GHF7_UNCW3|nr:MAG: hypothetical protein AMJ87_06285 [candidate division WOR_3 bacterium SM23_60]